MQFDEAFQILLTLEGGYVDDPNDPGGRTNMGITERFYPDEHIESLTVDRARQIYKQDYWDRCCCDELPGPLNLLVYDTAVNQGPIVAIRTLQRTLKIAQDGIIGPQTLQAAKRLNGRETCALYLADRALVYTLARNFGRYGRGWFKRLFILAMRLKF